MRASGEESISRASWWTSWCSHGAISTAERFLRQFVGGVGYEPRVVINDKLASYPPAMRRVLPNAEHTEVAKNGGAAVW